MIINNFISSTNNFIKIKGRYRHYISRKISKSKLKAENLPTLWKVMNRMVKETDIFCSINLGNNLRDRFSDCGDPIDGRPSPIRILCPYQLVSISTCESSVAFI